MANIDSSPPSSTQPSSPETPSQRLRVAFNRETSYVLTPGSYASPMSVDEPRGHNDTANGIQNANGSLPANGHRPKPSTPLYLHASDLEDISMASWHTASEVLMKSVSPKTPPPNYGNLRCKKPRTAAPTSGNGFEDVSARGRQCARQTSHSNSHLDNEDEGRRRRIPIKPRPSPSSSTSSLAGGDRMRSGLWKDPPPYFGLTSGGGGSRDCSLEYQARGRARQRLREREKLFECEQGMESGDSSGVDGDRGELGDECVTGYGDDGDVMETGD